MATHAHTFMVSCILLVELDEVGGPHWNKGGGAERWSFGEYQPPGDKRYISVMTAFSWEQ